MGTCFELSAGWSHSKERSVKGFIQFCLTDNTSKVSYKLYFLTKMQDTYVPPFSPGGGGESIVFQLAEFCGSRGRRGRASQTHGGLMFEERPSKHSRDMITRTELIRGCGDLPLWAPPPALLLHVFLPFQHYWDAHCLTDLRSLTERKSIILNKSQRIFEPDFHPMCQHIDTAWC